MSLFFSTFVVVALRWNRKMSCNELEELRRLCSLTDANHCSPAALRICQKTTPHL